MILAVYFERKNHQYVIYDLRNLSGIHPNTCVGHGQRMTDEIRRLRSKPDMAELH